MSDINGLREMIHNGCYANCDVTSLQPEYMNDISTMLCDRQDQPASAFHNDGAGVPGDSAIGPHETPGGKFGDRSGRWPSHLAIPSETMLGRDFCFAQTSWEI